MALAVHSEGRGEDWGPRRELGQVTPRADVPETATGGVLVGS